jgi:hypothetical protein
MKKKNPLRGRNRRDSPTKTLLSFLMERALIGDFVNEHEMSSWRDDLRKKAKNLLVDVTFWKDQGIRRISETLKMNDRVVVSHLNPSYDSSSSPAVDPLEHRGRNAFSMGPFLRRNSSPPVLQMARKMSPPLPRS